MIIDSHVHLINEEDYLDKLIAEYNELGIDKLVLFGAGPKPGMCATNEEILEAREKYPDKILPFAYIRLGEVSADQIDGFAKKGFMGLKTTKPLSNYDDKSYFPIYERATVNDMPILFHLGTVMRTDRDRYMDVSCDRMRPVYLDTIARAFPELNLIGAHLANPWYDEAAMTAFWNPNVFFDLSGTTLKRNGADFLREKLWWGEETFGALTDDVEDSWYQESSAKKESPFEKIVFGTDCLVGETGQVLHEYKSVLEDLNLESSVKNKIMGGTIADLLGI